MNTLGVLHRCLAVACAGVLLTLAACQRDSSADAMGPEAVVLLHGMGRTDRSMQILADRIEAVGYSTHNIRYPSLELAPEQLVEHLAIEIEACCADAEPLHFVTHSLGGILVRAYAAKRTPPNMGRVVMLAPPNHGSEYVDVLREWGAFQLAVGPTGVQLGTEPTSLPNRLPAPDFEFGVIAGVRSRNPITAHVIEGPNDGTVSLASTQLLGMQDFITVDETHTFIMRSPVVARETIAFLRDGKFESSGSESR